MTQNGSASVGTGAAGCASAGIGLKMGGRMNGAVDARGNRSVGSGLKAAAASSGRKDTVALKKALADILGVRGGTYWGKFKEFVLGKCSRKAFDAVAANLLVGKSGESFVSGPMGCEIGGRIVL